MKNRRIAIVFITVIFIFFGACGGKKIDPDSPQELPSSVAVTIDAPEQDLYDASRELYEREIYTIAIDTLKSLINNYPRSQYVEFAQVKLADSYFQLREFRDSASHASQFIENYPNSASMPYMLFLAARSNQFLYRGTGRDIAPLNKAQSFYQSIITDYPSSDYFSFAGDQIVMINQEIANYERSIVEFYKKRELDKAVEVRQARLDNFLSTHQTELENIQDTNIEAGVDLEQAQAVQVASVLKRDLSSIVIAEEKSNDVIASLSCKKLPAELITISFVSESLIDRAALLALARIYDSVSGQVEVPLPLNKALKFNETFDCFDAEQVVLSKSSKLRIKTDRQIKAFVIENPLRLMLNLNKTE